MLNRFFLRQTIESLIFVLPVFFLAIKSATISASFLLFFISSIWLYRHGKSALREISAERKNFLLITSLVFCFPLMSEVLAQVLRMQLLASSLDGPSRFLMAGVFFLGISLMPDIRLEKIFHKSMILCLLATAVAALLSVDAYRFWNNRASTYFIDPITLGCYVSIILGALATSFDFKNASVVWRAAFVFAVIVSFILILISGSRIAWVVFFCSMVNVLFFPSINKIRYSRWFAIAGLILLFLGIALSPSLSERAYYIYRDIEQYLGGNVESSIGARVALFFLDLNLFWAYPLSGLTDGFLPRYEEVLGIYPHITEVIYKMKLDSGSHQELMGQLVRRGFWGFFSIFSCFLYPMIVFCRAFRTGNESAKSFIIFGIAFVSLTFFAGLGIQVFNLKVTSTFYAFTLSILYGALYRAGFIFRSEKN